MFEELPICTGCGTLVDASRPACATCNVPHRSPPLRAVTQPSGGYWVAVRATFSCSACRFDVPLNHFALGDGVVCTRCGVEQRYEASSWRELVDFAHAVGDLGGPGPEGRFPDAEIRLSHPRPFPDLGTRTSFVGDEKRRASPGNPLCAACGAPRVVLGTRERVIAVGCTRCGVKNTYEIPANVHVQRLAGVLADEHEEGGREASIVDESGVVILRCPSCSAPLQSVGDADGVVTCGYCKVPCRISSRTHARVGHKQAPVKTWWLYFDQPSAMRRKLVNEAREVNARERKRSEREAQRLRSRAGQRDASALPSGTPVTHVDRSDRRAKEAERKAILPLLAVLLAAPIIGGVIWYQARVPAEARRGETDARPDDDVLLRYSFKMTPAETRALLGATAKAGAKIKLRAEGTFTELELGGVGGPTHSLTLSAGPKFDTARVLARLSKMAPNRIVVDRSEQQEIDVARTLLRIDPRPTPMYKARLSVMTWVAGEQGATAADAFLAALRHAALDGPAPTPSQLRLLNGTPLADASRFDVTVPIEDAAVRFSAAFATGGCATSTDLVSKRTELTCTTDIDHPVVTEARLAWPSTAKARLRRVTLVRSRRPGATTPDPTDCLSRALGEGERKVVDFASGRATRSWTLGKRGDRVVVDDVAIEIATTREDAKTEEAADWSASYARIIGSLATCSR